MEDEKIVALYFSRSESAISETENKYGGLCFEISNRIVNSRPDAEECVSDSYLSVWNAIPPTKPLSFRGFLLGIVRNISLMRLRRLTAQKRSRDLEVSFEELGEILPDSALPENTGEKELGELLDGFLRKLPEDQRNIFLRKYWFFDSVEEISRRFGFSESKVKTSLHRTRERLRAYLSERGFRL